MQRLLAQDGPAGDNAQMVQQVSAENRLWVLGLAPGMQEVLWPGGLGQGWQDSVTTPRAVPTLMGCRWARGDYLCGDDTLALQSASRWSQGPFPSEGPFPFLPLRRGLCPCLSSGPCSNLGNLS